MIERQGVAGLWRDSFWSDFGGGRAAAGALQGLELLERVLIRALGEGDAALEAAEDFVGGHEGLA